MKKFSLVGLFVCVIFASPVRAELSVEQLAAVEDFLELLPEQNLHCVLKNPSNNMAWFDKGQIRHGLIHDATLRLEIQHTEQGGEFRDTKRKDLLKALMNLTFLRKLALCNFNLMLVPAAALAMPGLIELNLGDNVLVGLPPQIFDLQNLRVLDLSYNFIFRLHPGVAMLNCPNFRLNLEGNFLAPNGYSGYWGLAELQAVFGDALILRSPPVAAPIVDELTDDENDENVMNYNPKRRRADG